MSVQRRVFLSDLVLLFMASIGVAASDRLAWAQRPAHPIARPPIQRPDRPLVPGRFRPTTGGVPANPSPGLFTIVAINTRAGTIQLRDDGGRSGIVHVDADMIDLESLKAGDLVEVDFLVPEPGSTTLKAAGIWSVAR